MYYSLLPGTNQFIEKNGTQGQAILRRHGYNASRRPNHYDYYRALQGEQREGLFDDLASVLGSVAKVWGGTPSRNPALSSSNSTTSDSLANLGSSSPFQMGSIPAKPDFGNYFGNQNGGVPRGPGRNSAYLELVSHFRNESIRRNYMQGLEQNDYYQLVPPIYSVGVQFAGDDQSQGDSGNQASGQSTGDDQSGSYTDDLFTEIRKPLFIIGGVILALIIWSKIR